MKKKLAYFAIIVLTACISVLFISACSTSLPFPTEHNIDINDQLSWSEVDGARGYMVEIKNVDSGKIDFVETDRLYTSLSKLAEGDYEIRLKTIGGASVKDSDWSESFAFKMGVKTGLIYGLINNNTEYRIEGAGAASGDVVIEDKYKGKPVTAIAAAAFRSNAKVTSLVIGNNVKSIGPRAFLGVKYLTSITIPDSVKEIGAAAFQSSSIESITIPDAVTVIEDNTFSYCKSLKEVNLGSGITAINDSAFAACSALTSIIIPDSVTRIGNHAFSENSEMTTVTFGKGLTTLGNYAFARCSALENLNFSKSENLTKFGERTFFQCKTLSSLTLPKNLDSIGKETFLDAEALSDVNIPSSITHIGESAFKGTEIYEDALAEAGEDRDDFIEKQFIYVGNWLVGISDFYKTVLSSSLIPRESRIIYSSYFKSGVVGIADSVFAGCKATDTVELPNSLRYVGKQAFSKNEMLWRLEIPNNSVQVIDDYAFSDCIALNRVSLGEGLKSINLRAFSGCTSLDNAAIGSLIPESVTSIGNYAFLNTELWKKPDEYGVIYASRWIVGFAENILEAEVRNGTRGISDYAFYMCVNLKKINNLRDILYIGTGAFYGCMQLEEITLGNNVNVIRDYTFYMCPMLTTVVLPTSLTSIGRSAFYDCLYLKGISFGSRVVSVGDFAFYNCSNMSEVNLNRVQTIGNYAFFMCVKIERLTIPSTVKTIGTGAFYNCELLEEVTFLTDYVAIKDNDNEEITVGITENGVKTIGNYAFANCISLKAVVIPSSVETLGNNAFYNCNAITQLSFSVTYRTVNENGVEKVLVYGIKTIGNYAFAGLDGLKRLELPETLKRIGNFAFKNCNSLSSVVVPVSVAQIDAHIFYGCKKITVYTDAQRALDGWNARWNSSFRPVVFGCVLSDEAYVKSVVIGGSTISNRYAKYGIAAPERAGYVFVGWATSADSTTAQYTAANITNILTGATLYALWEPSVEEDVEEENIIEEDNAEDEEDVL